MVSAYFKRGVPYVCLSMISEVAVSAGTHVESQYCLVAKLHWQVLAPVPAGEAKGKAAEVAHSMRLGCAYLVSCPYVAQRTYLAAASSGVTLSTLELP